MLLYYSLHPGNHITEASCRPSSLMLLYLVPRNLGYDIAVPFKCPKSPMIGSSYPRAWCATLSFWFQDPNCWYNLCLELQLHPCIWAIKVCFRGEKKLWLSWNTGSIVPSGACTSASKYCNSSIRLQSCVPGSKSTLSNCAMDYNDAVMIVSCTRRPFQLRHLIARRQKQTFPSNLTLKVYVVTTLHCSDCHCHRFLQPRSLIAYTHYY